MVKLSPAFPSLHVSRLLKLHLTDVRQMLLWFLLPALQESVLIPKSKYQEC